MAAAGRMWRRAHRHQREAATEERVHRVGDLELYYIPIRWVVEGGVK